MFLDSMPLTGVIADHQTSVNFSRRLPICLAQDRPAQGRTMQRKPAL